MTPKKLALDIWGALVQIMQHEFDEVKKHDREAFKAEHGWTTASIEADETVRHTNGGCGRKMQEEAKATV